MMNIYQDFKEYVMEKAPTISKTMIHDPIVFMFTPDEITQAILISDETFAALKALLEIAKPKSFIFVGEGKVKPFDIETLKIKNPDQKEEDLPEILLLIGSPESGKPEVWTADLSGSTDKEGERNIAPWVKIDSLGNAIGKWIK